MSRESDFEADRTALRTRRPRSRGRRHLDRVRLASDHRLHVVAPVGQAALIDRE